MNFKTVHALRMEAEDGNMLREIEIIDFQFMPDTYETQKLLTHLLEELDSYDAEDDFNPYILIVEINEPNEEEIYFEKIHGVIATYIGKLEFSNKVFFIISFNDEDDLNNYYSSFYCMFPEHHTFRAIYTISDFYLNFKATKDGRCHILYETIIAYEFIIKTI